MSSVSLLRGVISLQQFRQRKYAIDMAAQGIRLMWTAGIRPQWALDAFRRAVFAYLFAKSQHGHWILYITHPKVDPLLIESELAHFGLFPDEGPSAGGPHSPYVDPPDFYRTSRQLAEQMVKEHSSGEVYRCFCARNMQSSVVEDRFVACGNECDKIPPEVSRKLSKRRRSMIRLKAAGPLRSDIVLVDVNGLPTICYKNALRQRNMLVTHVVTDALRQLVYNHIYKAIGIGRYPQHLTIGDFNLIKI